MATDVPGILIVDDNEDNRYTLQLMLESDGHERITCAAMPGCRSYDSTTNVVKWFCSEDEARAEGYTKAGNGEKGGR